MPVNDAARPSKNAGSVTKLSKPKRFGPKIIAKVSPKNAYAIR